ncbi:hypothetical protein M885DRAFT_512979 [Pelagophyceae sp. CCMP2097]|nr:hypothetical protein M885DRAFT_512979 [Pelagophyceae sp. CCMP2097]
MARLLPLLWLLGTARAQPGACRGQVICDCETAACRCGDSRGMAGCCNSGCGECADLCGGAAAPVEGGGAAPVEGAVSIGVDASAFDFSTSSAGPVGCSAHLSCAACAAHDCGWCLSQRACREDEPWKCQGEEDHVGKIGRAECPGADAVREDRRARRSERLGRSFGLGAPAGDDAPGGDDARGAPPTAGAASPPAADGPPDVEGDDELRSRAAAGDGAKRPYETLEVDSKASSAAVRRAYKRLSLLWHPDKHKPALRALAAAAFAQIVAAYEVLSVPDLRQKFDDFAEADFGHDFGNFEAFTNQWDWEMYGGGGGNEQWYKQDAYVLNLAGEERWNKKIGAADAGLVWVVEFYAPWCGGCRAFAPVFKDAAKLASESEDVGNVEFGAINCVEHDRICREWYGIRAYPTLIAINEPLGLRQEYFGNKDAASVVAWAKGVASEWRFLVDKNDVHVPKSLADYDRFVLETDKFVVSAFFDGLDCAACKTVRTDLLRLSAGLAHAASRPHVIAVDCDDEAFEALCYAVPAEDRCPRRGEIALCLGLPPPPHAPLVFAFGAGAGRKLRSRKAATGELLYNPNDAESPAALEALLRTLRLALPDDESDAPVPDFDWNHRPPSDPPPRGGGGGGRPQFRHQLPG